jgi:hypothetical protein
MFEAKELPPHTAKRMKVPDIEITLEFIRHPFIAFGRSVVAHNEG